MGREALGLSSCKGEGGGGGGGGGGAPIPARMPSVTDVMCNWDIKNY